MSTSVSKPPKYSLHKAAGQARVRWEGRSIYLGVFGDPERHAAFVAGLPKPEPEETAVRCEPMPGRVTVGTCALLFYRHAEAYYVHADGRPTGEHVTIRCALVPLNPKFADLPAADFGPKRLKEVRENMIALGSCRRYINNTVNLIRRCFSWCV